MKSDTGLGDFEYGLFVVNRMNVGDDIQSLAALRFLPRVDHYIDRDQLDEVSSIQTQNNRDLKMIMNGWYLSGYDHWPPKNDKLKPLLTSIHVNPIEGSGAATKAFKSDASVKFLKKHSPVGARDKATLRLLQDSGIDAYFSACLTLTLNADESVKKKDFILAVNVSDDVYAAMKKRTKRYIVRMDVEHTENTTTEENLALAQYYLYMYQSAHCVVTTRLHATLPTIAVGGKVLFVVESNGDNSDFKERFSGLYELANHTTAAEFITGGKNIYNIDSPPENPSAYKIYREKLENICIDYTGYDSQKSYLFGKTLDEVVTGPGFFSAVTRISEESWDAYKYEHKWSVPAIMYDDVHQSEPRKEEIKQLERRLYAEQNPGIITSFKRLLKSLAFKAGIKHRK
ncbi:polysaccharide pyruvyl transferase family protein [Candidatus Saccharibacteria bacterium]|nr:polysaccharide pyruvyl transferase family protein [Candidatus Saccharibacteria bacterium]